MHELFNLSVNKFVPGVKPTSMGMKLQVLRYQNTIKMYQNVSQKYQKIILVQKKNNGIKMYYSGIKMYHKGIKKSYWYQMRTMFSSHRIQTNARCEKQLCGKGHSSGSRAVYEFSNGSPSGRSSQRAEGTTDCVFGGTCGSVHVESFNKNMKVFGVLESQWDPIHKQLVRRLLEEQDKVLRSYFAQKGGARSQGGEGTHEKGREHVKWEMYA